jgi:eukaryotic-like serine/threonine-protein kinase
LLCYRCGSHVPDGSEACSACGQRFDTGLRVKSGQYRRRTLELDAGGIKAGDVLAGRYEVRGAIGTGPLGVVFRVRDREADVELALKVIAPNLLQSPEERAEFLRSLKQARRLSHPNLVRIHDSGQLEATATLPARAFFTSQLLEGMTLRRVIELRREKGQVFSLQETEPILAQIAQALDHASRIGPHADLKPENVMILPDLLKVMDFGVATAIPRAPFLSAQRQRKADSYIAPELFAGQAFDQGTDVYALGVILGEMLAGVLPSPGSQPPELRERQRGLPTVVQAIYRRAANPDPQGRYPTAGDLANEIFGVAEGGLAKPSAPLSSHLETSPSRIKAASLPVASPGETTRSLSLQRRPPSPETPWADVEIDPRELKVPGQSQSTQAPREGRAPAPLPVAAPSSPPPASLLQRDETSQWSRGPSWLLVAAALTVSAAAGLIGSRCLSSWGAGAKPGSSKVASPAPEKVRADALAPDPGPPDAGKVAARESGRRERALQPALLAGDAGPQALGPDAAGATGGSASRIALVALASSKKKPRPAAGAARPGDPPASSSGDNPPTARTTCPRGMVLIPAGSFALGTSALDDLSSSGDRTERRTTLKTYCVDSYEYPDQDSATPLTSITFPAADATCKREGKRLCSEEEWEKACKGPANHRFPYGESFEAATCRVKGELGPAGSAAGCRSGYGVLDMSGNAAEWTASHFQPGVSDRTVKGGGVGSPDADLRCSSRTHRAMETQSATLGFRCCSDLIP